MYQYISKQYKLAYSMLTHACIIVDTRRVVAGSRQLIKVDFLMKFSGNNMRLLLYAQK